MHNSDRRQKRFWFSLFPRSRKRWREIKKSPRLLLNWDISTLPLLTIQIPSEQLSAVSSKWRESEMPVNAAGQRIGPRKVVQSQTRYAKNVDNELQNTDKVEGMTWREFL